MRRFAGWLLQTLSRLAFAAVIGVFAATTTTCGVGLFHGTDTWCGLPLVWFVGFPMAIAAAFVLGVPLTLVFRKFGLRRWWQFAFTGLICAVPVWRDFAQPFDSVRWAQSGFFDSLIFLGSGFAGGLAYWWIYCRLAKPGSADYRT